MIFDKQRGNWEFESLTFILEKEQSNSTKMKKEKIIPQNWMKEENEKIENR